MTKETFLEVVSHLVGYVHPDGDKAIDNGRYDNQEKIVELLINGVEDLIHNAQYKNYKKKPSVARIGIRAYEVLKDLHETIEEALLKEVDGNDRESEK